MTLLRAVEVKDTELLIQIINEQTGDISQIVTIPKNVSDITRKFWAHTAQRDSEEFRLYIEYEDGRLQSYEVNSRDKKYIQLWEIVTFESFNDLNEASSNNQAGDLIESKEQEP
jgi:hypothetical protein